MQLAGNFGARAIVGGGIDADAARDARTGASATDRGPIAAICPALMLGEELELIVFEGEQSAGAFFNAGGEEAVGKGEDLSGFVERNGWIGLDCGVAERNAKDQTRNSKE